MIYKDIVEAIKDICGRFKGVKVVKYQGDDLNNQQNNNDTLQCYIDDISHHQFNLTTNIVKAEYEIYILGFPTKEEGSILDVQDRCYNAAINILYKLDNMEEYQGIISVYDYDILTISHYTDDLNAGVKLSVVLSIPNGINLCEVEDNFNDTAYVPEVTDEITLPKQEDKGLDLKPVKLPKKPKKC